MKQDDFASALNTVLVRLNLTHSEFGERVGLSQPAITRLIGGKPASRTTYKKIFDYFKDDLRADGDPARKELAMALMQGYLRDAFGQFDLRENEDEILGISVAVVSDAQALAGSMFKRLPTQLILALYAIGLTAEKNDAMKNILTALAEACVATPEGAKIGFQPGYFTPGMRFPPSKEGSARKAFRIFGGSLAEMVAALRSKD